MLQGQLLLGFGTLSGMGKEEGMRRVMAIGRLLEALVCVICPLFDFSGSDPASQILQATGLAV